MSDDHEEKRVSGDLRHHAAAERSIARVIPGCERSEHDDQQDPREPRPLGLQAAPARAV